MNNDNYKQIVQALQLRRREIAAIMGEGYSGSLIDAWSRSESSTKNATGNTRSGSPARFKPLSDEDFARFCRGLHDWILREGLVLRSRDESEKKGEAQ